MKLVIEIDTTKPIDVKQIRAEAAFLVHVADNAATFFNDASGNPTSVFQGDTPDAATVGFGQGQNMVVTSEVSGTPTISHLDGVAPKEVDSTGLPWDARIHAGNMSKTAKGEWKKARGVDEAVVAQVTAELRGQTNAAPAQATTQAPPPPPPAPVTTATANTPPAPPPIPASPAATVPPVPGTPQQPPAPPPIPAAPSDDGTLAAAVTRGVQEGKITMDDVNYQCMMIGRANLGEVLKVPGEIAKLHAALAAKLG